MTATLVCDICRTPKDSVRHYTLTRQERDKGDPVRRWRKHMGTIDLCDGCLDRTAHDGRNTAHKVATSQRIEFGRSSR